MNLTIKPAKLCGAIAAIPSKSDAHRLLILAALSGGETRLIMPQRSEDIDATIRCLRALGATIELVPDGVRVRGITKPAEDPLLDCGESGSTFRFLLPVAAALCERVRFPAQAACRSGRSANSYRRCGSTAFRFPPIVFRFPWKGGSREEILRCRETSVRSI